ncbi:MAG TPA: FAD:protein FMN transferase, partial [Euryarchaeota archaeon]|nr:FAD:protein FMN transferase [Euryarchaeota archaeon]
DPRTGRVPEGLASATIIGKDATTADAMSTAVFVLGPEAGLDVIEKTLAVEGLLVTSAGEIIESSGFNQYTV